MTTDRVRLTPPETARALVTSILHDGGDTEAEWNEHWDVWREQLAAGASPETLAEMAVLLAEMAVQIAERAAGDSRERMVELVQGVLDHNALTEARIMSARAADQDPDG